MAKAEQADGRARRIKTVKPKRGTTRSQSGRGGSGSVEKQGLFGTATTIVFRVAQVKHKIVTSKRIDRMGYHFVRGDELWRRPLAVSGLEPCLVRDIHCFLRDRPLNPLIDAGLPTILDAVQGLLEGCTRRGRTRTKREPIQPSRCTAHSAASTPPALRLGASGARLSHRTIWFRASGPVAYSPRPAHNAYLHEEDLCLGSGHAAPRRGSQSSG